MKFENKKRLALAVAIATSAFLTGCGAQPSNQIGNVPGAQNVGGCAPIGVGQIGFTASNILVDSSYVKGGPIPYEGTIGQILMNAAGGLVNPTYPTGYGAVQMYGQQVSGTTIQMTLSPTNTGYNTGYTPTYPNYTSTTGTIGNANGTGTLNLSPTTQSQLMSVANQGLTTTYPYQNPYQTPYQQPVPTATTACVSQMAIKLHHTVYAPYTLYMGSVYLYVNNTQRGLAIDF